MLVNHLLVSISHWRTALTPHEVEEASMDDQELREIRDCVRNQNWEDWAPSYKVIKDSVWRTSITRRPNRDTTLAKKTSVTTST